MIVVYSAVVEDVSLQDEELKSIYGSEVQYM